MKTNSLLLRLPAYYSGSAARVAILTGAFAAAACGQSPESSNKSAAACALQESGGEMSVSLPSGTVMIGEDGVYPEEGPTKKVSVDAFEIDRTEVTNKEFREFVEATGYVTRAERGLDENVAPGLPAAFYAPGSIVFSPPEALDVMDPSVWWRFTPGANWRHPYGPGSTIEGKDRYPVDETPMAQPPIM